ncbi:MAG: hypothetical protein PHW87_03955 [Methanothrix sp.]|nr:hypothetical protein [Methanothrix sp.]
MLAIALIGMAGAANYMYEKASVKGVGYKNVEMIVSTQTGFNGQKLVEKEAGSGNVITERTELEAERQLKRDYTPIGWNPDGTISCDWPTGTECPMDYINFTKEAEFEYMPVSYQTGTYDQKWIEKLCVQNYRIGAVLTEMYTHAEHLQKTTEVKTRGYGIDPEVVHDPETIREVGEMFFAPKPKNNGGTFDPVNPDYTMIHDEWQPGDWTYKVTANGDYDDTLKPPLGNYETPSKEVVIPGWTDPSKERLCNACCTGVLEANLNSNVIGVAHIGWISRDPTPEKNLKGRHAEYGRSVEDLTGVFSIEKFIQLWGNSTCGAISVDWLPCV